MSALRVLVVEDSLTVRRYLCDVLNADPELSVVGEAADGETAIALCESLSPSVVTMDMMLNGVSGLAATQHIMTHKPTPILVVSSSENRGEVMSTYDALAAGAVDALEKPAAESAAEAWENQFREAVKLVARIRAIRRPRISNRVTDSARRSPVRATPELIAIGASTGGPTALVSVLGTLPKGFPIPVLVVMHLSEAFAEGFTGWLGANIKIDARFARDGEPLARIAGTAILAPPNRHLILRSGSLHFDDGPERHSCKPSVDVLFDSVARSSPNSVGCLLTGMGRDGATGLSAMKTAGALTIVQDEASCAVFGMPREAIRLGAATQVLPLAEIGPAIAALDVGRRGERHP
ncbi:MAG: chemotaxis-specific protein-glutamate methyltransferase CheB [Myxococcales bacterium]|nr:chemotaxis-specific protein-glutamate methyltransferase CheB [Myxococcales bacterium]